MDADTKNIIVKLVNESNVRDIKNGLRCKYGCKCTADITEVIGQLFIGAAAIISFSAPSFNIDYLSYIAGVCGVIGIVLLKFSSYTMKESKERTDQVNRILTANDIMNIPDITIDSASKDIIV